jgi:transposase
VLIATRPVDFRKGADSLAALAEETLAQDPFSGAVLVFRSRRADRIKILVWDGSVSCWYGNGSNRAPSNGRRSPMG